MNSMTENEKKAVRKYWLSKINSTRKTPSAMLFAGISLICCLAICCLVGLGLALVYGFPFTREIANVVLGTAGLTFFVTSMWIEFNRSDMVDAQKERKEHEENYKWLLEG